MIAFGPRLCKKLRIRNISVTWWLDHPECVVLHEMEYERELFIKLLRIFPDRLTAVKAARGGHTDF